ncbi:LacI family DNA-binding transcriptional regulator [Paenibacillus aurantiacus]|uniref:LacI family DNA-binding transcriptional regulator n=1 Tax=Paenibacillus aurantiacus TaxID=1936118 RepID=A0ABV5KXF1_9BACL
MKEPTIMDVARQAGVSVATVSRVLNGSTLVNASTQEKVMEVVRSMHYTPNAIGKQLRSQKTMTIAVVVPDISITYCVEIIKGIENTANPLHYKIIICDAQNKPEKEREFMTLLVSRTVDALILVTPSQTDAELATYADNGYTLGVIGRDTGHDAIPCALTDNVKLTRQVMTHLIGQGHTRIAFLSGFATAIDNYERLEGYMKGLQEARLPFMPELVDNGDFTEEGGYAAFMRLWERNTGLTAVFAANDEMALGVHKACGELNIPIPDRMAIVGVDNSRLTNYVRPQISSVEQPLQTMGVLLAGKLIDQMNANEQAGRRIFKIDSILVVKGSSLGRTEEGQG